MAAGAGLNLPQARLPQPTVFDGTTPPFHEWIQETCNKHQQLRVHQTDGLCHYALQTDREVALQDVTDSTTRGRERREPLDANERAQDALQEQLTTPPAQRAEGKTDQVIRDELGVLQEDPTRLEDRGGDYQVTT